MFHLVIPIDSINNPPCLASEMCSVYILYTIRNNKHVFSYIEEVLSYANLSYSLQAMSLPLDCLFPLCKFHS